jgi:iron(III) transport system ATP-binding protein
MELIAFENVSKRYNSRSIIEDFYLEIGKNERLVILGPSGCGKTTALRLLAGFIAPDSGRILIDEEVVAANGKNLREPEERNLGMVFQDLALWPHLSVKGNLEFGLKARGIPPQERKQRIAKVLHLVRLGGSIDAKVTELSGGEQQRVALARALVLYPKILLMDEPLSSLDFELNLKLRKEIIRLQAELGFTLVYVTHNLEEAFDLSTRIVVMKQGRIEQMGTPEEISGRFRQVSRRAGGLR